MWDLFKQLRPAKRGRRIPKQHEANMENDNDDTKSCALSSGGVSIQTVSSCAKAPSQEEEEVQQAGAKELKSSSPGDTEDQEISQIEDQENRKQTLKTVFDDDTEDQEVSKSEGQGNEMKTLETVPEETESQLAQESGMEEEQTPSLKFCVICDDHQASDQFPSVPELCAESHGSDACAYDWDVYLEMQIDSQRPDRITCIQCSNALSQADIRRLCTGQTYEKFLEAELRAVLSADETFTWCISPSCKSGQQHFDGDIFTCLQCGHKHCTSCHLDWHSGETCESNKERKLREEREALEAEHAAEEEMARLAEEQAAQAQRLEREEAASSVVVDRDTKICPGENCKKRVVKIDGCDHMTCMLCAPKNA